LESREEPPQGNSFQPDNQASNNFHMNLDNINAQVTHDLITTNRHLQSDQVMTSGLFPTNNIISPGQNSLHYTSAGQNLVTVGSSNVQVSQISQILQLSQVDSTSRTSVLEQENAGLRLQVVGLQSQVQALRDRVYHLENSLRQFRDAAQDPTNCLVQFEQDQWLNNTLAEILGPPNTTTSLNHPQTQDM
jgi:hypothetical protein